MKPRTIILLVVAVVCGLAAMYMTNRLLADKGTPPPVATVKVLVSKQKINPWTPIKKPEEMFEVKEVPEGTYSPKCITDYKKLQDMALRRGLDEQMPITPDDLLSETTSGIIGTLKPGQRAVALRVTPESLAGGFVLPGSKVDVMWIKKRGDGDSETQIILQDMLVLAVDMKNTRDDGQTAMLGSTATLAATPEEAESLALCGSLGDLRLMLRTPLDGDNIKYKPFNITNVGHQQRPNDPNKPASDPDAASNENGGGLPVLPKIPDKAPTPPPVVEKVAEAPVKIFTMRVVNGDTVTKFVYWWDAKNNCWQSDEEALKKPDADKPDDAKPADAPKPTPAPAGDRDKAPVG